MHPIIVWLRQDLRLFDNPALYHAYQQGLPVLPIYILDTHNSDLSIGQAQRWWLHHSLTALKKSLKKHKVSLLLFRGNPEKILQQVISQTAATAVYWNRCYEPAAILRDKNIKSLLRNQGIEVNSYSANLLFEPWEICNQKGEYFKVFTPYWKNCLKNLNLEFPLSLPDFLPYSAKDIVSENLTDWQLLPTHPNWAAEFSQYFRAGEESAHQTFNNFLENGLSDYANFRDFPALSATSKLSPYLHFGEISPKQIWHRLQQMAHAPNQQQNIDKFCSELGWREFSYHLLYHFPNLIKTSFRSAFENFHWQTDTNSLKAWQQGMTGYPIIDAGMRQLWRSGWMHNRIRMLVASFLCKDLLIDWRVGATWFWDTLLDADLANNSASWQWVAGSGADAAPYFRIFNPVLQGEKFDPDGTYIKQWVPELALLPKLFIHQPWQAPANILKQAKIVLGQNYPLPIINHSIAREEALKRYKDL